VSSPTGLVVAGAGTGEPLAPPVAPSMPRLGFLDGLRGIALVLMVVNHTARWWMDAVMGWGRYWLVYGSVLLPAAIFLFLVGFCLPISYHRRLAAARLRGAGTEEAPRDGSAGPAAPEGPGRLLLTYGRRGLVIIGAGLLLNAIVFRGEGPVWSGGVLQTIGLSIVLLAPLMPLLPRPGARAGLLAVAVMLYAAYAVAFPALGPWVAAHPTAGEILFLDFPPWPWISAALIGLVAGWQWLEARARGAEARYFAGVAGVGAAALLGYAAWEAVLPTAPRFGFPRDFILNHHWTPRGMTTALVIGGVALLLACTYWLLEVRGQRLPWLVLLGQTALMLYFAHQLLAYTLLRQALGVRFNSWLLYAVANGALLLLLLALARAWLTLRPRRPLARP
jgi:uncharacterized membrane protein